MKIFVTKYALTDGIVEKEAIIKDTPDYHFAEVKYGKFFSKTNLTKKEYFLTMEEALVDAENRRLKKIASLEKQIQKLSKMKF